MLGWISELASHAGESRNIPSRFMLIKKREKRWPDEPRGSDADFTQEGFPP